MEDFDSLKNIWQQPAGGQANTNLPAAISNTSTTNKMKMEKQQKMGAIMLTCTAIFIACLALFGNLNFVHWYTYGGMVLICLICLAQAAIMYAGYKKIKNIDDTVTPAAHLRQWEAYYNMRKQQYKWNMPVYYILLNIAMAVYLLEIFTGRPLLNVSVFLGVYIAWMLFAYFYLGKKNIKKESNRLQQIIDELKMIEGQLNKGE